MSRQVVLRGVGGERVGVLVVRVLAAVVGRRLARQGDAGVVVRVDGLAEVDGVLELLLQHLLARVPGQLEQEEAGVGLWQEVIWGVVLVQHLDDRGREKRKGGREEGKVGRGRKEGMRKKGRKEGRKEGRRVGGRKEGREGEKEGRKVGRKGEREKERGKERKGGRKEG